MNARRLTVFLMVCALAFLCFAAAASAKNAKPADIPFTAELEGTVWFMPVGDPPVLSTFTYAEGTSPQLGECVQESQHRTPIEEPTHFGPGDQVFHLPDGDLYMRYWGYMDIVVEGPDPTPEGWIDGLSSFMITGGTGRYENAYGGGSAVGTLWWPGMPGPGPIDAHWVYEGTVKYASGNQPVSWASIGTNTNKILLPYGVHLGTTGKVQRFADGTLKGQVLLKALRLTDEDTGVRSHVMTKLNTFTFTFDDMALDQADFYHGVGRYVGADIAEFVAYLPNSGYDPGEPTMGPPMIPIKFLWIDFGEPGKADLMQWYVFMPTDEIPFPHWEPQEMIEGVTDWGEPIPIPNGNIQVHVGY